MKEKISDFVAKYDYYCGAAFIFTVVIIYLALTSHTLKEYIARYNVESIAKRDGINTRNSKGDTALAIRSRINNDDPSYYGNIFTETLLEFGAKVNIHSRYGDTLLMDAARYNNLKFVKLLLMYGANVNVMNPFSGDTALSYAVGPNNNYKIAKLLLQYNADINMVNNTGKTILYRMRKSKSRKIREIAARYS